VAEADETIFALASGAVRVPVAVMRISGPASGAILARLAGALPPPRRASLRTLRGAEGEVLDRALVLWLPGPGTYTGEDSAELHLHGGAAVIEAVAEALVACGARPAAPGEFTKRAFLNGRLDLTEAEAVADLIEAETPAQRRQALRQMSGELAALCAGWRERLRRLLAHQEALIDFPDEDLPPEVEAGLSAEMAELAEALARHLGTARQAERVREGLVVAVSGPPNVGKSTLINRLAGREVAIVSPIAGTTRDVLEVRLVLGGMLMTFLDTAGLRESEDPIEREGVQRAWARIGEADIVLALDDQPSERGNDRPGDTAEGFPSGQEMIRVRTKADLGLTAPLAPGEIAISAVSGEGLEALNAALVAAAKRLTAGGEGALLTRARHRAAFAEALAALRRAEAAPWPELRAEELRAANRALGRVTGEIGVEDILDAIFRDFCIGK
jgi:tRNA modification GTPase